MNPIELLRKHCVFETSYDCYMLMAISRKKDGVVKSSGKEIIFREIIKKTDDIESRYNKMKAETRNYTDSNGTKYPFYIYVSVNARDSRKAAFSLMARINSWILDELTGANTGKMYKRIDKAFYSELMKRENRVKRRLFMLDYDEKQHIESFKTSIESFDIDIVRVIESRNGYHVITKPFNTKKWADSTIKQSFPHDVIIDANLFVEYVGVD